MFGSEITFLQVVGYSISMVGFAVYQRGKRVQAKAEEREKEMDGYERVELHRTEREA